MIEIVLDLVVVLSDELDDGDFNFFVFIHFGPLCCEDADSVLFGNQLNVGLLGHLGLATVLNIDDHDLLFPRQHIDCGHSELQQA